MKKIIATLALSAAFLLGSADDAWGQETKIVNASLTIPTLLVFGTVVSTLALGSTTEADWDAGS
jgi:hypothetical protein